MLGATTPEIVAVREQLGVPQSPGAEGIGRRRRGRRPGRPFLVYLAVDVVGGTADRWGTWLIGSQNPVVQVGFSIPRVSSQLAEALPRPEEWVR